MSMFELLKYIFPIFKDKNTNLATMKLPFLFLLVSNTLTNKLVLHFLIQTFNCVIIF